MTIAVGNVTTNATTIYTSSGNTVVTFLSLCNYTANSVTANIFVVPSGGLASTNNIVITTLELASNVATTGDTYQFYAGNEKLVLGNGDTIQVQASANNSITTLTSYCAA